MVVGDDRATDDSLAAVLNASGLQVVVALDAATASAGLGDRRPAAIIVDQELAGATGEVVALDLKHQDPSAAVVLLTFAASLERVLDAAERLDGLLVRPLIPQALVQTVRNALAARELREENLRLKSDLATRPETPKPDASVGVAVDAEGFRSLFAGALRSSQSSGSPLALLLVELGGWRTILDESGEGVAEEAVLAADRRLSSSRRKTDLVGRVSENRFAVVCSDVDSQAPFRRVVRIVLDELDAPFIADGSDHWLAPTAGAVLSDPGSPDESPEVLFERAQLALDAALAQGRSWTVFEKTMRDEVLSRSGFSARVREAMEQEELSVAYRPLIELQAGRVVGATAHLRWLGHSEHDPLSSELLAAQGDVALSARISAWMLDRAFADLARWRDEQRLAEGFTLTLDVSSREVGDPQFIEELEDLLVKHGIDASMVGIDLSEHAARQASEDDGAFARLAALGVSFCLDDLGAGRTQLSWMRDLPVEVLKIDSSLVEALDTTDDSRGTALVRGLVALGRELHLTVVAKGVRTAAQRAALLAMGCDLTEQTPFGRPGPAVYDWQSDPDASSVGFAEDRAEHEMVNPEDAGRKLRT